MPLPAALISALPALIQAGSSLAGSYLSGRGSSGGSSGNASSYLNQIAPMAREQFNPYAQQGMQAQNQASNQYNRMSSDPMSYINQIISGYKPSAGYQFKEQKALDAARNSAAAGGFAGTRNDQMQQADMAQGLAGQDMQEWLSNVLGIQGAGLSGQQHVADRGYNASQSLANMLSSALGSQSGLAYEDQKERRGNNQALMGGLSNLIGMGANTAFGGGSGGMSSLAGMLGGGTASGGTASRGVQPFGQNSGFGNLNLRGGSGSSGFGSIYGGGRG